MEARSIEYEMAMDDYRKEQQEMDSLLRQMAGKYDEPKRSVQEFRRALASKLQGVSASQMIIEAR